jgi:hypothetical protein
MNKNKKLRKVYFQDAEWYPIWIIDNDNGLPLDGIEVEISEKDYKEIMDIFKKFLKTQNKIEELIEKHFIESTYAIRNLNEATKVIKELHGIMKDVVKESK